MAKFLVTGGFGAIGSWVTRHLVNDGHDVTVLSRRLDHALLPDVGQSVRHHAGSILDLDCVRQAITSNSVDHVIHCAAALGGAGERDPRLGYETNIIGSLNVFQAAHEAEIQRVVYTSTKGVYGRLRRKYGAPEFAPISEDVEGHPYGVYGASKKATEGAAEQCRRLWGMEIIALRLGSTFGPGKGGQHAGYSGMKARIIQAALDGTPLTVDNPDVLDDVVYNSDVGRAHVQAVFAKSSKHQVFNIACGQLVSLREWTEKVMHHCPGHQLVFGESNESVIGNATRGLLDISLARIELGYEPQFPGTLGVEDYVERERTARDAGRN